MQYNGGKQKIAKHLAKIINTAAPEVYWEPFCGMCSVGRLIQAKERIFTDASLATVSLVNAAVQGYSFPSSATEAEYNAAKTLPEDNPLHGFFKFGCSFAGKPWGGFARSGGRNYAASAANSLKKLEGAGIRCAHGEYDAVGVKADVVYADPPYGGTTACGNGKRFDSGRFWQWVREYPGKVFVSEYAAPPDFQAVFEAEVTAGLIPKGRKNVERLFVRK